MNSWHSLRRRQHWKYPGTSSASVYDIKRKVNQGRYSVTLSRGSILMRPRADKFTYIVFRTAEYSLMRVKLAISSYHWYEGCGNELTNTYANMLDSVDSTKGRVSLCNL